MCKLKSKPCIAVSSVPLVAASWGRPNKLHCIIFLIFTILHSVNVTTASVAGEGVPIVYVSCDSWVTIV